MSTPEVFADMPEDARLWIHVADRPLSEADQSTLLDALTPFFSQWKAHGYDVTGEAAVLHDRFLLVAAYIDHPGAGISGCGIDALVNQIETAADALDIGWASPLAIFFRDTTGTVQQTSRSAFQQQLEDGTVDESTSIFDPSLTTVKALRDERFEQPLKNSFLSQMHPAMPPSK